MMAKTLFGMETVLARELKLLGAQHVQEVKRGVTFEGDFGFLYKANLWLRTAIRILLPLETFMARDENYLYKKVKEFPWEDYFEVSKTIVVDATVFSEKFTNSLFIAQKVKDGIADRFREISGRRPTVDVKNAEVRINVHISGNSVTLALDSSGDSLHKRGYRTETNIAPISEALAAGIISLTEWDKKSPLIDPMCGSGTFLIESALMGYNIPPNIFRKEFSFKHWKNFDQELFSLIFDKALEKENDFNQPIMGFDKSEVVVRKAGRNIKSALMHNQIEVHTSAIEDLQRPEKAGVRGTVIMNPPYGKKIEANIPELYESIGNTLKQQFQGYKAWIFTANPEGLKHVGLRPFKRIKLYNGKLECILAGYELYSGSRKAAKQ